MEKIVIGIIVFGGLSYSIQFFFNQISRINLPKAWTDRLPTTEEMRQKNWEYLERVLKEVETMNGYVAEKWREGKWKQVWEKGAKKEEKSNRKDNKD